MDEIQSVFDAVISMPFVCIYSFCLSPIQHHHHYFSLASLKRKQMPSKWHRDEKREIINKMAKMDEKCVNVDGNRKISFYVKMNETEMN